MALWKSYGQAGIGPQRPIHDYQNSAVFLWHVVGAQKRAQALGFVTGRDTRGRVDGDEAHGCGHLDRRSRLDVVAVTDDNESPCFGTRIC